MTAQSVSSADAESIDTVKVEKPRNPIQRAAAIVLSAGLFRMIPPSFLPDEDQGYFITIVQLPEGASKQRTDAVLDKVEKYFLSVPAIQSTDAMSGLNFVFNTRGPNGATMFLPAASP